MILCEDDYPRILDQICDYLTAGEVELSFAPILEYCLKDDALGDPMINDSQILALGDRKRCHAGR